MRKAVIISTILSVFILGCKKEFDQPPVETIPEGSIITIAQLRDMYSGTPVHFSDTTTIFATVSMDESTGNIYKTVYIEDGTAGIELKLLSGGGLYEGDSIRINLNGTVLSDYNEMIQLDSVDVDVNIVKQATQKHITPMSVALNSISADLQGRLVKIENVEFIGDDLGSTYADAINLFSENRYLTDCSGNQMICRTSGYADFAGEVIASGNGSIVGVIGQYGTDLQFYIRSMEEVDMDGERCTDGGPCGTPLDGLTEDFSSQSASSDIALNCWSNLAIQGSRLWQGKEFSGNIYAQATAYNSSDAVNESWLVSPEMTFANDTLSFQSAQAFYAHDGLTVWVATNFNGADVSAASWTQINCTIAGSGDANYAWVNSGNIDLSAYLPNGFSGTYHIAFKYLGNAATQSTNYAIDNIEIKN